MVRTILSARPLFRQRISGTLPCSASSIMAPSSPIIRSARRDFGISLESYARGCPVRNINSCCCIIIIVSACLAMSLFPLAVRAETKQVSKMPQGSRVSASRSGSSLCLLGQEDTIRVRLDLHRVYHALASPWAEAAEDSRGASARLPGQFHAADQVLELPKARVR